MPERHLRVVEGEKDLDSSRERYKKIILKSAAILTAVLAIAGLARKSGDDINPVAETVRDKNIELYYIKVGDEVKFKEGVFMIDTSKINIRKDPAVFHDSSGESNKWKPNKSSDLIYVQNPAYIATDVNGDWFEAVGKDGQEVFFTGDNGGISDVSTGKNAELHHSDLEEGIVIATTTKGNAIEVNGDRHILASIENVN